MKRNSNFEEIADFDFTFMSHRQSTFTTQRIKDIAQKAVIFTKEKIAYLREKRWRDSSRGTDNDVALSTENSHEYGTINAMA